MANEQQTSVSEQHFQIRFESKDAKNAFLSHFKQLNGSQNNEEFMVRKNSAYSVPRQRPKAFSFDSATTRKPPNSLWATLFGPLETEQPQSVVPESSKQKNEPSEFDNVLGGIYDTIKFATTRRGLSILLTEGVDYFGMSDVDHTAEDCNGFASEEEDGGFNITDGQRSWVPDESVIYFYYL